MVERRSEVWVRLRMYCDTNNMRICVGSHVRMHVQVYYVCERAEEGEKFTNDSNMKTGRRQWLWVLYGW